MAEDRTSLTKPAIYRDRHFDIDAAKIGPGEYYITQRDMVIVTVLGSCVSACMRDPVAKVGGSRMHADTHEPSTVTITMSRWVM